jgi:predicted phosphodiesterase
MNLSDRLAQPPLSQPTFTRSNYQFSAEIDPRDPLSQAITLTAPERLETEQDWAEAVERMGGGTIPPGYKVRLVEMRHNTHGWSRAAQGEDALTTGTWFYRFAVEPVSSALSSIDDILGSIKKRRPAPVSNRSAGPSVYHYLAGDLQLGKVDGDSTEGIVDTLVRSLEHAANDLKEVRRRVPVGTVHLAWLGDCLEGNQSQGGKNMWRTELTVTEQIRVFRRLMLYGVDLFAPLVEHVEVDVVNGNHDDVQRMQRTRGDDGHATEAAISLADALTLNPTTYGHVSVFVPERDATYMTRQIGSSTFTMAHGHQWRRGKAWDWWAGQALNLQNPGASHFLLHGHYHTMSMDTKRERTIICTPTFESESTWWKEKTGDLGRRGALTMLTRDGEFSHLSIV